MAGEQRVYSDEEFALILHKAAELANHAERPGVTTSGLTLREMQSAAQQAGLDPALVERAARLLAAQAEASPLELVIGGPLRHHVEARFPATLDDQSAARLLSAIRIAAAHYRSSNTGHSSALGVTWDAGGEGDVFSVVARPESNGTEISVVIDRRGTFVLVGVVSCMASLMSVLFGMTMYQEASAIAGVSITAVGVGGTLAVARHFWSSSTAKLRERIGTFMDAIGQTLANVHSQEKP